ncbi:MAG TPA: DUF4142 domain-containing protein [Mucilaginibacter sp.]|jgi:putative membrane protein
MKASFKNYLPVGTLAMLILLFACHSAPKDSISAADSANKKLIAADDSARKAQRVALDSADRSKTALLEDASKFLVKCYESGMYETQLSQLAATNALDADVKNLAATLVTDHTAINAQINAIAASANLVLPAVLTTDHQKDLKDMTKLTGADFDKKYASIIISGHEKSISNYKDAYKHLAPSDTKTFAGETLPKIQDHLAMAKKVKDRIK